MRQPERQLTTADRHCPMPAHTIGYGQERTERTLTEKAIAWRTLHRYRLIPVKSPFRFVRLVRLCPYQGCMRQPERQLTTADRHWGPRSRWI